jgi:crotonobetainyl-CoA:carnitine CoA-transferase CaiB-like acyl-CoA transferase
MNDFSPFGALAGLKVIDLTRVLGGPYCTQILADHGAEVVKIVAGVDPPARGRGDKSPTGGGFGPPG